MKNVIKRFWPLLLVGLILIAVLIGVLVSHLRSTPERAVEGYIRASLQYDADGLLKYASAYQLTALKGNVEMDLDTLRETLKTGYGQAMDYRETGKITFESEVKELIEPGTEAFEELLTEYAFKADPSEVQAFASVTARCYIDGKLQRTYSAIAVRCDGTWYYGFIA